MNIIKIMTPKALTVFLHTGDTVRQGLELLRQHGYTAIPVLNDQGEYLGSITEGDFLRHILAVGTTDRKAHEKYRIGGLLRPDFCPPLGIRATPDQVAQALLRQNFIPIVDDRNCFCGIVTRRSFMAFKTSFIFSFPFLSQFGWFYYIPGQGDLTTRALCVTIWLHLL